MDLKVRKVQQWLNFTYNSVTGWESVDEDGITGGATVSALIRALQYELGLSLDGIFGDNTKNAFDTRFPNGLNNEIAPASDSTKKIIYILRGGMYCRGIDGGDLDGFINYFDDDLKDGIKEMKTQLGILNPTDETKAIEMKAVLTTDAYILISGGDTNVREIQQNLNRKYLSQLGGYLATNGLYERNTNMAIRKAVQAEIGVTPDGAWGSTTKSALPLLVRGSTNTNLIYLLQYLLYLNGFNPNGFDGGFGGGVENAVRAAQTMFRLDADGMVGRQTWCALALSCGDTDRDANACDTCFEITASRAQVLLNNGYTAVGRYLSGYIDEDRPKELQSSEVSTIINSGLKLFLIFQKANNSIKDFGYNAGYASGLQAKYYARKHCIPTNAVIYFAVDFDVYPEQISTHIIPHFSGIIDALDNEFQVGVYAPRLVCQKLYDENLTVSSFVSDSSTGFSCNVGQKMPTNWCYDQFTEISNFNNDFDIDKVIYNQSIAAVSQLGNMVYTTKQELFYTKIKVLYYLTKQYASTLGQTWNISKINKYVFNYLRNVPEYRSITWFGAAGDIDDDYIEFMDNNVTEDFKRENIEVPAKHIGVMSVQHMAATVSAMCHFFIFNEEVDALSGWAGDLIQLGCKMQTVVATHTFTDNEIYRLIGCSSDSLAQQVGLIDAGHTGFSLEDLEQDIDSINLSMLLDDNTEAYTAVELYYMNENTYRNRIGTLLTQYFGLSSTDDVTSLTNIAESYTDLERLTAAALAGQLGGYNASLFKDSLASQFANKLIDMYNSEISS